MYWAGPSSIESPLANRCTADLPGDQTIAGDDTIDVGPILAGSSGQEVPSKVTCWDDRLCPDRSTKSHLTDEGARIYGQEMPHLFTSQTGLLTSPKPC